MPPRLSYQEYEQRRLGNRTNELAKIMYMFRRSFGSASFAGFWRYWNPFFSYYLYYFCYRPLARFLPRPLVIVSTFAASGAIHDLFASIILFDVFILFIPVFSFWGLLVMVEEGLALSFSQVPRWIRSSAYALIIIGTLLLGLKLRSVIT